MKRVLLSLGLLSMLGAVSTIAHAQNDTLPAGALQTGAAAGKALQILEIEDTDVASLRTLSARRPDAISLGASLASMRADSAAMLALATWVRDGGVVFLHTNAAQLFGYRTVQARVSSPQMAGQLYGRARNALPFGAHPLLWSGTPRNTGLPSLAPTNQIFPELGVQTVFYQLNAGDALAVDHPAAVPLLRVTDLASPNATTLYAAAIAPFGNGWAVFSPRFVEQNRADGASFAQNLLRLVRSVGPSPFDAPPLPGTTNSTSKPAAAPSASTPAVGESLVGVSGPLVESLSANQDAAAWPALFVQWQKSNEKVPASFLKPEEIQQADVTPRLLVARSEADAVGVALAAAAKGGDARGLQAILYLWRARLEYQRFQNELAETWLQAAEKVAPQNAETLLWRGIMSAASAQNIALSAQIRAQGFNDAAERWTAALAAAPLVRTAANAAAITGVPAAAIRAWQTSASRAAQLMSVEPPFVAAIGDNNSGLVVRHFENDPTLRLALPGAALLGRSDALLGWHLDEEEILIFPSDEYYAAYSQMARIGNADLAFNPLAQHANVVGNRILMVSQISLQVLVPGTPPRYVQLGVGIPAVLARLHAQVLANALTQDGTPAPAWMQLGLMSLSNVVVVNDTLEDAVPQGLRDAALAGGLLPPRGFDNLNLNSDRAGLAEAQARSLLRYFYQRYGAGAVIETLQRLGSGETLDDALVATTGGNETQFFLAWRAAQFGR